MIKSLFLIHSRVVPEFPPVKVHCELILCKVISLNANQISEMSINFENSF
jgi:hypothetical protein